LDGAVNLLDTLEKHGQKLIAVYIGVGVDPASQVRDPQGKVVPGQCGFDPRIKALIPKLAGHGTVVWIVLNGKQYKPSSTDGDERAVTLIREIADAAQPYGVRVSLYPHLGAYAQRMEDVVRLAEKARRSNVGVTFTFCHFLAIDQAKNLDRILALAQPYLNLVTINGTDGYKPKNGGAWIRTLDEGSFDVSTVLVALHKIGYRGPIGMIAFGIKGDRREVLARSIKGWQAVAAKAAAAEAAAAPQK
jgi:sugar phosphate isomerase/epimerase